MIGRPAEFHLFLRRLGLFEIYCAIMFVYPEFSASLTRTRGPRVVFRLVAWVLRCGAIVATNISIYTTYTGNATCMDNSEEDPNYISMIRKLLGTGSQLSEIENSCALSDCNHANTSAQVTQPACTMIQRGTQRSHLKSDLRSSDSAEYENRSVAICKELSSSDYSLAIDME